MKHRHDQPVATLIYKANGNVPIICKRFHPELLLRGLGLGRNEQMKCTETYKCHDFFDQ